MNHPTDLTVFKDKYKYGGHLCIRLLHQTEFYATLSCNVPEAKLAKGEFIVKNYSENEGLDDLTLYKGMFEDTGRTFFVGYTTCPIWRLTSNAD